MFPVINKIDLPSARPEEVKKEIEDVIGIEAEDAPEISAKNGIGIDEVLPVDRPRGLVEVLDVAAGRAKKRHKHAVSSAETQVEFHHVSHRPANDYGVLGYFDRMIAHVYHLDFSPARKLLRA